jgi:ribosome biogenesis GTPase A
MINESRRLAGKIAGCQNDFEGQSMSIQWYPGHMNAAKKKAAEQMENTDLVIEVVDARLPEASTNPMVEELRKFRQRPCLKILNKIDLADPAATAAWTAYYNAQEGVTAYAMTTKKPADVARIPELAKQLAPHRGVPTAAAHHDHGDPNVGKSTLMNALLKKRVAKVGDEPAVTKQQQKLYLDKNTVLVDTPGMLWPKIACQRWPDAGGQPRDRLECADRRGSGRVPGRRTAGALPGTAGGALRLQGNREMDAIGVVEGVGIKRGFRQKGGDLDYEKARTPSWATTAAARWAASRWRRRTRARRAWSCMPPNGGKAAEKAAIAEERRAAANGKRGTRFPQRRGAEAEAADGEAAHERVLVIGHGGGFLLRRAQHHHQRQQMLFARMRHACGRRLFPLHQLRAAFRRQRHGLLQPAVERMRADAPCALKARRLWKLSPLPIISTPCSRSGASRRPTSRCVCGSSPYLSDSCTIGTSAFGYTGYSALNVPWSKPRCASSSALWPPASSNCCTCAASSGEPGAGTAPRRCAAGSRRSRKSSAAGRGRQHEIAALPVRGNHQHRLGRDADLARNVAQRGVQLAVHVADLVHHERPGPPPWDRK